MNLSTLIPDNSNKWVIQKDYLMVYKYAKIPIAFIDDKDNVVLFLDNKVRKDLLRLISHLQKLEIPFIFYSPVFQNPKKVDEMEFHTVNIKNYLFSYSDEFFYDGFHKINFELTHNLIAYCNRYDCFELVRPIYDQVNKHVQKVDQDWYSMQMIYNVKREDIRDTFNSLYRDIQLSRIMF